MSREFVLQQLQKGTTLNINVIFNGLVSKSLIDTRGEFCLLLVSILNDHNVDAYTRITSGCLAATHIKYHKIDCKSRHCILCLLINGKHDDNPTVRDISKEVSHIFTIDTFFMVMTTCTLYNNI